ncbi:MAG: TrbI/VirB10 family protein [Lentisphaerae bacterium]|nr:TrbI/VirB10 family protein [Lentisphaerota bacterium]
MNANELVNILKSPTSKVIFFGILLIGGALIVIPFLSRDDDPKAVKEETELTREEKEPIEMGTEIPRFKVEKTGKATNRTTGRTVSPPPVINTVKSSEPISGPERKPSARELAERMRDRAENNRIIRRAPQERNAANERKPSAGNSGGGRIYVMTAQKSGGGTTEREVFLSERYAPYGRLLNCKLVNTLESNVDGTPLIAMVIEDLWWVNAKGERKLVIPAGTEVHGKMGSCVRNRMMASGNFVLVWQLTSGEVGMELQLNGRVLEKSNQAGNKNLATITDMAAGIPGRVMNNTNLNEMLQYTMAFMQGLSSGLQTTRTYDNGHTIINENDGSTKNALASAFQQMSEVALENISDKINKESYYIRVAAGTEFYLYIEQVTNVEKAAIADTALNNLAQLKQSQKTNRDNETDKLSQLHDSLGKALPRSLKKELNLKGL